MSYLNSEELIKQLKKGDEKAYTYLIDLYYESLCDYARNLSRDHYLSEDIVQNVFIKIWDKRAILKTNFIIKKYLYKAVFNEFINQYRKDIATTALEKKYIEEVDLYLENEDEQKLLELINLVKQQIELLPPKCKETFLLSRYEGLTYVEISKYLNVSIKTVEDHMSRAFATLSKTVGTKMNNILFLIFGMDKRLKYL
jgi:RNA polymerase sigma-70 factor (ECF subfamily)